jgi:hypothetical protein
MIGKALVEGEAFQELVRNLGNNLSILVVTRSALLKGDCCRIIATRRTRNRPACIFAVVWNFSLE